MERINIELLMQNSILPSRAKLPSAINVPRFKVSGKLHTLQVNLSDTKYKALMRFIDTAIPKFGDGGVSAQTDVAIRSQAGATPAFLFPPNIFGSDTGSKYNRKDDADADAPEGDDVFVDAEDSTVQVKTQPCQICTRSVDLPSNVRVISGNKPLC